MNRPRRLAISVRGLILAVVVIGLAMRFAIRFVPLTPNEAIRVARAEIARRDPEFPRDAQLVKCRPDEVNVGHLWGWAYRWVVVLKRPDADQGYLIEIHHRDDIRVGRAHNFYPGGQTWEMPR